jgi:hypothetical protein
VGNSAGWCNAKKQVLEFAIHWLNRTNAWTPGRRNALGYPLLMLAKNFHGLDFREYVSGSKRSRRIFGPGLWNRWMVSLIGHRRAEGPLEG